MLLVLNNGDMFKLHDYDLFRFERFCMFYPSYVISHSLLSKRYKGVFLQRSFKVWWGIDWGQMFLCCCAAAAAVLPLPLLLCWPG